MLNGKCGFARGVSIGSSNLGFGVAHILGGNGAKWRRSRRAKKSWGEEGGGVEDGSRVRRHHCGNPVLSTRASMANPNRYQKVAARHILKTNPRLKCTSIPSAASIPSTLGHAVFWGPRGGNKSIETFNRSLVSCLAFLHSGSHPEFVF